MLITTETGVTKMQESRLSDSSRAGIWSFVKAFSDLIQAQRVSAFPPLLGELRIEQQNEFTTFYTASAIQLDSGERVGAFTIADNRYKNRVSGRFEISNRCISHEEVKQHYPGWRVISGPRGHSLEEQTLFALTKEGMTYTFGFAEKAPDCLNSITVGPSSAG